MISWSQFSFFFPVSRRQRPLILLRRLFLLRNVFRRSQLSLSSLRLFALVKGIVAAVAQVLSTRTRSSRFPSQRAGSEGGIELA